jgi:hypothetical protein
MVKHGFMMGKELGVPHVYGTLFASCTISSMVMGVLTQDV